MWENAFLLVECKDLPKPHNKFFYQLKKKRKKGKRDSKGKKMLNPPETH